MNDSKTAEIKSPNSGSLSIRINSLVNLITNRFMSGSGTPTLEVLSTGVKGTVTTEGSMVLGTKNSLFKRHCSNNCWCCFKRHKLSNSCCVEWL